MQAPRPAWVALALGWLPLVHGQDAPPPASELLARGEAAYNRQDWPAALDAFQTFLNDYGGLEGAEETTRRVRPLAGICQVRLGQFESAAPLLAEALADPGLDPALRTDLRFFAGLTACRTGKHEEARRELGQLFNDPRVETTRRLEALILGGLSYVLEANWPGAIGFFQKYRREIRAASPEAGGRADLLHLHALMQAGRWDEALVLAGEVHARRDDLRQLVTFASLTVELGARSLEQERPHAAIAALRLVPPRADLVRDQQARLRTAEADLAYARRSGNSVRQSQLQTSLAEMAKDLAGIEQMPQFDAAARLRLAQAYHQLGRTREACLILDQMVRQLDPDPVVESATLHLIGGWMALGRWNRAVRAADVYLERFGGDNASGQLPGVLFARAQALEGQGRHDAAAEACAEVSRRFPDDALAARARFQEAYNLLQLERHREAETLFASLLDDLERDHELWPHAAFWRAMTFYFDQEWASAREHLDAYLEATAGRPGARGDYDDDAPFRRAYSFFAEALYDEAVAALQAFEKAHPASEWLPEAQLTLGDSLAALGELDAAVAAYARIDAAAHGFHDEGWMKRGHILRLRKDLAGLKAHGQEFLRQRPDSPRLAEALHWLGWAARQEGRIEEARQIYWEAVRRFGNDPVRPALEDLFLALGGFYPGDQQSEFQRLLQQERQRAESRAQPRYAARLDWTEARMLQRRQPDEARARLARLGSRLEPRETAPQLLLDCAEALAALDDRAGAGRLFEGLRRWYPRAPERDRAFAGLGFLALAEGDAARALAMFDRFEKTAVLPRSAPDAQGIVLVEAEIGGRVALARAGLLPATEHERALHLYLAVQRSKAMPSRLRAEAFLGAANLLAGRGRHREALPYYEQVYILFNRHPELVAQAYWGRGQALEKLGQAEKAREVYSELAQRTDLQTTREAAAGRTRALTLGGLIAPRIPEGGETPPNPATTAPANFRS